MKRDSQQALRRLLTKQGKSLPEIPWNVYPRPMMKRDSFFCLNGKWSFGVKRRELEKEILVPFCPESILSGVEQVFPEDTLLIYKRTFTLPEGFRKDRVLLHFGAVDQIALVYLNGKLVTAHLGGYTPFSADITDALRAGENILAVEVDDRLSDRVLPYGKQSKKRGGMWYTPVSGIWQTVWLESVPKDYIKSVNADTVGSSVKISVVGAERGTVKVQTPDGELVLGLEGGMVEFTLENPAWWSPESPYLYRYSVETEEDRVESYFALRTLTVETVNGVQRMCLNGKPYFFHGLLDQGYFSDGIFTPASPEVYTEEIERLKALGFNTLRKHIKIEPQIFYAECDRLGMIVWQDMVNNGDYKYVRDTVLPTVGFIRKRDKHIHRNREMRKAFLRAMEETVQTLKSHPCICLWTIFNEGWGQFDSTSVYRTLKRMDATRFIDATSGWFQGGESDLESRHIYFKPVPRLKPDRPYIVSEFGGFTYSAEGHIFNPSKTYGYGACETREAYVEKVRGLYLNEVLPAVAGGLCATIYTQVSDVEDEINGLITYDREVVKLKPEEFADIGKMLQAEIEK